MLRSPGTMWFVGIQPPVKKNPLWHWSTTALFARYAAAQIPNSGGMVLPRTAVALSGEGQMFPIPLRLGLIALCLAMLGKLSTKPRSYALMGTQISARRTSLKKDARLVRDVTMILF